MSDTAIEALRYSEFPNNSDTISRQAAIDALVGITRFKTKHELMQRVNASVQDEQGWLGAVAECLDEIEDLPSAQPEIIRCKDCKHFEYNHPYIIQSIPVLGHEVCNAWGDGCKTDENGYCFMAERRTDE